jgi:hypothetical protein
MVNRMRKTALVLNLFANGELGESWGKAHDDFGPNIAKVLDLAVVQKIVSVLVLRGSSHGFAFQGVLHHILNILRNSIIWRRNVNRYKGLSG